MRESSGTGPATGIVLSLVVRPSSDSTEATCDAEMAVKAIACNTMIGMRNCA